MSTSASEITSRGWTVLPRVLDAQALDRLVASLDRLRACVVSPGLHACDDVVLADDVKVSAVGLTFFGLLGRAPELSEMFARADLVSLLHEVLGPELELEQSCGVISDETRPFFFWHNHLGGIDGEDFRSHPGPSSARIRRLVCTFYGTALDGENGRMLVLPRRVGDPLEPPRAPGREPWPEAVALEAAVGSIVVLDEATWHAVTPMSRAGVRRFAACMVRRAGLAPTKRIDPSVAPALAADPRLRATYLPAPAVASARPGRG
jgi:hypothetical protein